MRSVIAFAASALILAAAAPALAQTAQPAAASAANASAAGAPAAATSTTLAVGQPVKDKTGAVIGAITDLKPGAGGETATVKMGEQSFAIGAQSFVVQNGAAVINATQDQLKAMIASASKAG